jgi:hypothetical protein
MIAVAADPSNRYENARLVNVSEEGLRFVSEKPLAPEACLQIRVSDALPGAIRLHANTAYPANVRWCRQLHRPQTSTYDIGVRIEVKTDSWTTVYKQTCDLCGTPISAADICIIEDQICLCRECHGHLQRLPDGLARASITRFLMGNVV